MSRIFDKCNTLSGHETIKSVAILAIVFFCLVVVLFM